jgi:hypothetical protein
MAGLKAGMIQRIHKTQAKDIVHSSVYAKAQRAYGGGPQHESMSFSARTKIDQNRTYVQGYSSSHVSNSGNKMPMASSIERQNALRQNNNADTAQQNATVAATAQASQQRGYGRTSSQDLLAEWGYGRKSGDRESLFQGYGRQSGDKESLHQGYGRQSGNRESLYKGYGRQTDAELMQAKAGTGYANAAAQRQARADRFAGTRHMPGGATPPSAASRPSIRPNFGPHH